MSTFIAIPTDAYQSDKGLALAQKHIAQLGGSWEVETYTVTKKDKEGKEKQEERRRLRVTADDSERTQKHYKTKEEMPRASVADEIKGYLTGQYLWKVEDV